VESLSTEYAPVMPSEEDLTGAALALIRLQDTYNLNMSEMAAGKISGSPAFAEMTGKSIKNEKRKERKERHTNQLSLTHFTAFNAGICERDQHNLRDQTCRL
jgi:hypothetical protein